jgi:hypothetical protein
MILRFPHLLLLGTAGCLCFGCSSVSKLTSGFTERKKADELGHNPEQMRISVDGAVFQPLVRVDVPQFSGLQTPLVGGNRSRNRATAASINLPRYTPVKVLSNNGRYALIQVQTGERGFIPTACIATESAIIATARPATRVQPVYNNTASQNTDPSLYLPKIDAGDAPVDAAISTASRCRNQKKLCRNLPKRRLSMVS